MPPLSESSRTPTNSAQAARLAVECTPPAIFMSALKRSEGLARQPVPDVVGGWPDAAACYDAVP